MAFVKALGVGLIVLAWLALVWFFVTLSIAVGLPCLIVLLLLTIAWATAYTETGRWHPF